MQIVTTVILRLVKAEKEEVIPLIWSFTYFFCLLCGYYVLRPVRDEMAVEGGVQHLPWMMTATFLTLLLATPLFGYLSSRVARYRLLLSLYAFFGVNLIGFFFLMTSQVAPHWVARVFFVWLSVFNLFVVSIFWSFMADLFSPTQGARLFGVIAAGGSIGAIIGPLLTVGLTYLLPISSLMLLSAAFLSVCGVCIHRLDAWSVQQPAHRMDRPEEPIGGSMWAGIRLVMESPYLLGICLYLLCLTTTATFLYMEQTKLVSDQISSPEVRTRLFSMIDLAVNVITFTTQLFFTSKMISRFGLASALVALPFVSAVGFGMIGLMPMLLLYVGFMIVRRVGEYAIAKPAREVLFTVLSREEKYKAKNFIDTALSRGGDASTGWIVNGVKALGVTAPQIAWLLIPAAVLWGWVGWRLAREEERLRVQAATVRSS